MHPSLTTSDRFSIPPLISLILSYTTTTKTPRHRHLLSKTLHSYAARKTVTPGNVPDLSIDSMLSRASSVLSSSVVQIDRPLYDSSFARCGERCGAAHLGVGCLETDIERGGPIPLPVALHWPSLYLQRTTSLCTWFIWTKLHAVSLLALSFSHCLPQSQACCTRNIRPSPISHV